MKKCWTKSWLQACNFRKYCKKVESGSAPRARAFTLVELLVVIALIGILAALLLPALGGAKARSLATACTSNSKQLAVAWRLYADDNAGKLVNNAQFNGWRSLRTPQTGQPIETPNWVYGIMDWTTSVDNTNSELIAAGLLFPYTAQARLYKCPADRCLSRRQLGVGFAPRVRSVAMNAFVQGGDHTGQYWLPDFAAYAKESDLISPPPSQLWILADENPDTINDGLFRMEMDNTNVWNDVPGSFHNGACVFNFADGHVELHRWASVVTCPPVHYERIAIEDPGSVDIRWMYNHTSSRVH